MPWNPNPSLKARLFLLSSWGACSGGVCPPGVSDPDTDGVADPDPQCTAPWAKEGQSQPRCGLGAELLLLLSMLVASRHALQRSGRIA